jgi:hypothetical protein
MGCLTAAGRKERAFLHFRTGLARIQQPHSDNPRLSGSSTTGTRTLNLHRVKIAQPKSPDGRMATEAARLKAKNPQVRQSKTDLTLTGLLKEGVKFQFQIRTYRLGQAG